MRKRFGVFMCFLGSIILILFISQLQSCKHDPANISNLPKVCYTSDIKRILSTCSGTDCHSGGSRERGGFDSNDNKSIINLVKAGDPWGSKLYTIVSSPNNPNMMPPKGNPILSAEDRTILEVWILQGADTTKCSKTKNVSE